MTIETLECGHEPSPHSAHTAGYGTDESGARSCYACCAASLRADMVATGRATLYLTRDKEAGLTALGSPKPSGYVLTDWPGELRFATGPVRKGRHNIAGTRYDTQFRGPDGAAWHATQYGENTQVAHCRRTRKGIYYGGVPKDRVGVMKGKLYNEAQVRRFLSIVSPADVYTYHAVPTCHGSGWARLERRWRGGPNAGHFAGWLE